EGALRLHNQGPDAIQGFVCLPQANPRTETLGLDGGVELNGARRTVKEAVSCEDYQDQTCGQNQSNGVHREGNYSQKQGHCSPDDAPNPSPRCPLNHDCLNITKIEALVGL